MSEHVRLIWKKIEHLKRMRGYLDYSLQQTLPLIPIQSWTKLTPEEHESLAAFRIRFGEFQEHLGKTMRAIAIEEEQKTEPTPPCFCTWRNWRSSIRPNTGRSSANFAMP